MKKILIAGASGMIGGLVLQDCLYASEVAEVISIVRKSSGVTHPKLKEVILENFTDYSTILNSFQSIDTAFFCVGVYTGSVPDNEFKKITVDYAIAFADALKQQSPNATLCFLSGAGADLNEKSRLPFARYKGMAENYLLKLSLGSLFIFRPAYIYPVQKRIEPNLSYRIVRFFYPLMKLVYPQGVITSVALAKAIFQTGMNKKGQEIFENKAIKNLLHD